MMDDINLYRAKGTNMMDEYLDNKETEDKIRIKLLVDETKNLKQEIVRLKAMLFHFTGKME